MRELKMGDKEIRVRAVAPALFYYKKEFKTDLISDLIKVLAEAFNFISDISGKDPATLTAEEIETVKSDSIGFESLSSFNIDSVALLQIVWAMAKADKCGQEFPSFTKWLEEIDPACVLDTEFLTAAIEEAACGFLRGVKR